MENKFKPFDRVLVKVLTDEKWTPDLYSYYDDSKNLHWSIGCGWVSDDNILPYEGYEHLVGTDLLADEEVRLEEGEWVIVSSEIGNSPIFWHLAQYVKSIHKERFLTNMGTYIFAIRFKDFDPSNMEETKKHILCVKGGKIVKYKG